MLVVALLAAYVSQAELWQVTELRVNDFVSSCDDVMLSVIWVTMVLVG